MIQGRFVKNGEITEIYRGDGLLELIPAEVEPSLKPVEVEPLFYFTARKERHARWKKNLAVCLSVGGPMWAVALWNGIMPDAVFTAMCWASIIWAGIVIFANTRKEKK